jgi:uncharacterized protein (TIGR03083 family)
VPGSLGGVQPDLHLRVLAERGGALVDAAGGASGVPVPSCPDWTVADLVVHVGLVWGWAATVVTTGDRTEFGPPPADRGDEALGHWAREQLAALGDALHDADPDSACWTFGPPRSRRFWFRRQALETVLHAWDVEHATATPTPMDPEVAADGVDEHLAVIVPRALGRRHGTWSGETVHLHRTDGEGEWLVRLGPDGEAVVEHAHGKADVALRGTAEALWLWSTNRATGEEGGVERFGDEGILSRWRDAMVF